MHESEDGLRSPTLAFSDSDRTRLRSSQSVIAFRTLDVAGNHGLGLLSVRVTRSQPIPEDRLVAKEGVLDAHLPVVTRLLLPLSSSDLFDPHHRPVSVHASWPRLHLSRLGSAG